MIAAHSFAGKTVAVFGMGMSGLAAAKSLQAGGAAVVAYDDNARGCDQARDAGLPVKDLRECDWSVFSALVLAPGVPLTHPEPHWTVRLARENRVEIIGDTEVFCRERRIAGKSSKLIAITGTNGKSTTTALTHHLLAASGIDAVMGGNIGKAVLDLPPFAAGRHYVFELSSFQLDLTPSLDPAAAALLNITPDHLDRHGGMENYAAVKAKIFSNMEPGDTAIIGADDSYCDAIAEDLKARPVALRRISVKSKVETGVYLDGTALVEVEYGRVVNTAQLAGIGSLRGAHNAQNAAAALSIGRSLGLPWSVLVAALQSFPGLHHRMEEVRRIGNVLFINDSKATNADAAERALASFSNIYWIAGGKPKEGGIESIRPFFSAIRKAYLIGESAPVFAETLKGNADFVISGTLDAALNQAYADALADRNRGDKVVLLSPACASYDQFQNFEVRGDAFRTLVNSLQSPSQEEAA